MKVAEEPMLYWRLLARTCSRCTELPGLMKMTGLTKFAPAGFAIEELKSAMVTVIIELAG
jgi:hypothetical protein